MKLKKDRGKSCELTISHEHQERIKNSKIRMKEMLEDSATPEKYKKMIQEILSLELYDLNFLLGFFELADGSYTKLASYLGISPQVTGKHLHKIIKNIQKKCLVD